MSVNYTIQSGDTLTKIAQEYYGLSGSEAYSKALEIAKENNIENPNLIHAGGSLTLFDTKEENAPENQNYENTYKELLEKQKALYQYQDAQTYGIKDNSGYNPETDQYFAFANPDIFKSADGNEKAELYKETVLQLAEQDIKANDKGEKNGKIDFAEFQETQLAFFRATNESTQKQLAEEVFVLHYSAQKGKDPTQSEIDEAVEDAWQNTITQYSGNLADIFANQDINSDGFLDKTEIATTYVAMDAGQITDNKNSLKMIYDNEENSKELDGVIDLEAVPNADKEYLKELHNIFFNAS